MNKVIVIVITVAFVGSFGVATQFASACAQALNETIKPGEIEPDAKGNCPIGYTSLPPVPCGPGERCIDSEVLEKERELIEALPEE